MREINEVLYSTKPMENEEEVKSGLLDELFDLIEGPQNAEGIFFHKNRFA